MLITAISGIFGRNVKCTAEELALLAQQGDSDALDELLESYGPFMKKTASQVCKRFVSSSDDEYSIALSAFHEAVLGYEEGKNASFLTFAHMIIRRRIIDFIRKESSRQEYSHDFTAAFDEKDSNGWIEGRQAEKFYKEEQQSEKRKEEILAYQQLIAPFGLDFQQLVKVSPAHEDARQSCMQIAQLVAETDDFFDYLTDKKKLPIKDIEKLVRVSRKTLERNRKYIIAMAILIDSELHYLKDYLKERLL
ncbi:RNA polymerase sigma factor [Planomicrobium koreense]|uniref:RNA polymerase sigma factor SigI n=2 Tax=Planococcus koreensis TaxID=112331 RepID=A0A7W8CP76_9BACL|nr:RNA polymerase sigma-I factor [Planococcus koreensis]MBB5179070.1 RNA polymerase sigma factor [Planococcus koreensis]